MLVFPSFFLIIIVLSLFVFQVNVSTIEDPAEASFFESFEAAHSKHDLSGAIAKVSNAICRPLFLFHFYALFLFG